VALVVCTADLPGGVGAAVLRHVFVDARGEIVHDFLAHDFAVLAKLFHLAAQVGDFLLCLGIFTRGGLEAVHAFFQRVLGLGDALGLVAAERGVLLRLLQRAFLPGIVHLGRFPRPVKLTIHRLAAGRGAKCDRARRGRDPWVRM
jgi:hypothetical protein